MPVWFSRQELQVIQALGKAKSQKELAALLQKNPSVISRALKSVREKIARSEETVEFSERHRLKERLQKS
jgi:transcriptional regulator